MTKPRFEPVEHKPRLLDANERAALQAEWFTHCCPFCGRWHAGDGLCPRVAKRTLTRNSVTVLTETVEFWQDGEWLARPDDFTWDEVWGVAHVVAFQQAEAAEAEKRKPKDEEKPK